MTTFVDLYFPLGLEVDRDEVQEAIERDLGGAVEVVGSGTGTSGSNLDLEVREGTGDQIVTRLAGTLRRLGVSAATKIVVSDPPATVMLADVPRGIDE